MDKINEARKALIAFIGALGAWGITAAADGKYDQVELWGLCAVAVTGLSTWTVRNHEKLRSPKKNPWGDGKLTGDWDDNNG